MTFLVFHNNVLFMEGMGQFNRRLLPTPSYIYHCESQTWVHHKATQLTMIDPDRVPAPVRAHVLLLPTN